MKFFLPILLIIVIIFSSCISLLPTNDPECTESILCSEGFVCVDGFCEVDNSSPVSVNAGNLSAVSTFESIGLYWDVECGSSDNAANVYYRKVGETNWTQGHYLVYDPRNEGDYPEQEQYRGSLVLLEPNTEYEIKTVLDSGEQATITQKTWDENFNVKKTIYLDEYSEETLIINEGGSEEEGYVLYTRKPNKNAVIDAKDNVHYNIQIEKPYVIIRGLTLKGARVHAINILDGNHNIVIEDNDISGWGRKASDNKYWAKDSSGKYFLDYGDDQDDEGSRTVFTDPNGWGVDLDSAIYSDNIFTNSANVRKIIIQNNVIHHPRYDSSHWNQFRTEFGSGNIRIHSHPRGPQAITIKNSDGNLVIRNNLIYSDENHYFNDPFGAWENYGFAGFPNKDSDIYGNVIRNGWDDGIESEGANMNVRIWNNFIENTHSKIAISSTSKGPLYIWDNLAGPNVQSHSDPHILSYPSGPFLKAGGGTLKFGENFKLLRYNDPSQGTVVNGGATFVYHNTILETSSRYGISGSGGIIVNMVSRNNVILLRWPSRAAINDADYMFTEDSNDFDYDMYFGRIMVNKTYEDHELNGIKLETKDVVKFVNENLNDYRLAEDSEGYSEGILIPGFNEGYDEISMGILTKPPE